MTYTSRLLLRIVIALALLGSLSTPIYAAGGASFSLRPVHYDPAIPATQSYFIIQAENGLTYQNEVRVTNTGDAAGTAHLYAVDATTGANSGPVYLASTDPRTDVGAWISLDQHELTLEPGESRIVKFTMIVPRDARPGQHLGGLVSENAQLETQAQTGALQVSLQHRMVAAVQVILPGPVVEQLAVTDVNTTVEAGFQLLRIGLRNDGTEMVKPAGTVEIVDAHGQTVQKLKLQLESILPQNEIQYPISIERQALAAGDYQARVAISYGKQGITHANTAFTVSSTQVAQLYEAQQQALPPSVAAASTPVSYLPWILSGVLLVVLFGTLIFRRK